MEILIKTIDEYESSTHKNKTIVEYIIYVMVGDTPIKAYTELGLTNLYQRLDELKK
jgi:hypothetical protein